MVYRLKWRVSVHSCSAHASLKHTCTVDIATNYASSLDKHVVACGRYCSRTDGIGISRVPPNLDRVSIGIDEQENQDRVQRPSVDSRQVESHKADEQWKSPYLADHGCESKFVPNLAQVCQDEHRDDCASIRSGQLVQDIGRTHCAQHNTGWSVS